MDRENSGVTVLITAYNEQKNIKGAIESSLNQSHGRVEVLVVNDGSTDATGRIARQIKDQRVRVLDLERVGRVAALNKGIKASRGDLVAILDADDRCLEQRVERQHRQMVNDPKIGVIGSCYVRRDDIRNEQYVRCYPERDSEIRREMSKYIPIAHSCAMLRKQAVLDIGGYKGGKAGLEDMDLWIRLAQRWKLANIPEPLVVRHIRNDSYWHRNFYQQVRNAHLAQLNAQAISELSLPRYLYMFPLARLLYSYLPVPLKCTVRRLLSEIEERDLEDASQIPSI